MNYCRVIIILSFCLSGCNFAPQYKGPEFPALPQNWKAQNHEITPSSDIENWWEIFDDETLNCLELQALANNKSLVAALEKVFEARAQVGITASDLYPQLNLEPSYFNTGVLVQVFGIPQPPPPSPRNPTILRTHSVIYELPLVLNYELDLWGKIRNNYKADYFKYEAEINAFEVSLLILTSDLAVNYFQLRTLDRQIELLKNTIRVRKDAVDVNKERFDRGFANYSDVSRAETLLFNAESEYSQVIRLRALKENQIAVLIGATASDFKMDPNPLNGLPPLIPAGIPSTILLKRPDMREIERKAAAENALIGSAYASYFPSISLTGYLGYESPDLKNFLTWFSRLWTIYVQAKEPVFDGFRTYSRVEFSKARFRQASANYQQQALVALREVEDSLANIQYISEQIIFLEKSVASAKETTQLSLDRYLSGRTNYLDVADSERVELETRVQLNDLMGKRFISTIELIKALGGSWYGDGVCCITDQED